ncbi:MAG: hypothetical protein DRJ51_09255, partial [Thermoprotei archaeon]
MVGFRKVFTLLLFLLILLSVGGLLGLKAEAQVAGTLSLSSPTFSGFSLLQITVIDKDLSDTEAAVPPPTVTVNGTTVKMFQAVDGSWFGFIRVWCWADTVNTNGVYDPGEPI